MISNSNIDERCPDCGRWRTITSDQCKCGFRFPQREAGRRQKFIRRTYSSLWGNKFKRKNTVSALIVLIGLVVILEGFNIERRVVNHQGTENYYKVRKAYLGTDKYYLSSSEEMLKRAETTNMVGVIIACVGIIAILSKWLIRPMNANSAKHNKYDDW